MPSRIRRRQILFVTALLLVTECSGGDTSDPTTTAPTTTTSRATTTTTETTSTTAESTTTTMEATASRNKDAFCDAYLAFVAARDPENRVEPLNVIFAERGPDAPEDLNEVFKVLVAADYGQEDVRPQQAVLRDFVMPICEETYNEGVIGAETDAAAAEQFFAALVAGDKSTALTLAPAQTVALLEPWEAYPEQDGLPELVLDEGQFYVTLTSGFSFRCEVGNGVVTGCFFG